MNTHKKRAGASIFHFWCTGAFFLY